VAGRKTAWADGFLDFTAAFPGRDGAMAEDFYFELLASNS